MKIILFTIRVVVFCVLASTASSSAFAQFDKWFYNKTMRVDFYHAGNSEGQKFYLKEIIEEPYYAGSHVALTDEYDYGVQQLRIIDKASGKLLYSRGYCTLFNEWMFTSEAKMVDKALPESVVFPYPKKDVVMEIWCRMKNGEWKKHFSYNIDVKSQYIKRFSPSLESFDVLINGNVENCVDIVLLSEGFTENDKSEFERACKNFASIFDKYSPYKENARRFNFRAVWCSAVEAGVDIPGEHVWKNTPLGASFYTFGSERYQMVEDYQLVRNMAAHVPYDYIYILTNSAKYGGGAIYNFYGISSANHPEATETVYIHEFGHLLLGLGDEYVEVGNEMSDSYPAGVEPWEANLTTLTNFDKKKDWKTLISSSTPIPTPIKTNRPIDCILDEKNPWPVGVYEGGGYVSRGVYRPWPNCMMNTIAVMDKFCPVCSKAIQNYIDFLCR